MGTPSNTKARSIGDFAKVLTRLQSAGNLLREAASFGQYAEMPVLEEWDAAVAESSSLLMATVPVLAEAWSDAHSADRMGRIASCEIIRATLEAGFSIRDCEIIYRSKHLRWFFDYHDTGPKAADIFESFQGYLDRNFGSIRSMIEEEGFVCSVLGLELACAVAKVSAVKLKTGVTPEIVGMYRILKSGSTVFSVKNQCSFITFNPSNVRITHTIMGESDFIWAKPLETDPRKSPSQLLELGSDEWTIKLSDTVPLDH